MRQRRPLRRASRRGDPEVVGQRGGSGSPRFARDDGFVSITTKSRSGALGHGPPPAWFERRNEFPNNSGSSAFPEGAQALVSSPMGVGRSIATRRWGRRRRAACCFSRSLASDIAVDHCARQRVVRDGVVVPLSRAGMGERGRRGPLRRSRPGDGHRAFHPKAGEGVRRFHACLCRAHRLVEHDPSPGRRRLGDATSRARRRARWTATF